MGEEKRNEFAQSVNNNTSICPIASDTLQNLIIDNKKFALGFYKFINFRIKKLERHLQLLLFKDTKTRLLEFINELSEEFGIIDDKTNYILIQHPYTQKDMSTLIGTSRPTLNIVMNELKEDGIIDFKGKTIKLFKK